MTEPSPNRPFRDPRPCPGADDARRAKILIDWCLSRTPDSLERATAATRTSSAPNGPPPRTHFPARSWTRSTTRPTDTPRPAPHWSPCSTPACATSDTASTLVFDAPVAVDELHPGQAGAAVVVPVLLGVVSPPST